MSIFDSTSERNDMFEPEVALPTIAEPIHALSPIEFTALIAAPLSFVGHTAEPLSFTPHASVENSDPNILQVNDVIAIDKNMLEQAISNATVLEENRYFDDQSVIDQINQQKITHEPFITFDLGLSENELAVLDKIEIKKTDTYNRYGELENLNNDLPTFLRDTTTADESQITVLSSMIDKLTTKVVSALDGETAWFALRTYTPTNKYDTPRWHVDDHFTGFGSDHEVKFATALKGPQTLLYPTSEEDRTQFLLNEENGKKLSQLFHPSNAVSAKQGQGVIFIVGDPNNAAIHAEPKTDKNRIFLSVVPGSHANIRELDRRWNST